MEDKKVNAPVTFRADEETRKRFEKASIGFKNKNVFVHTLLDIYEKNKALTNQAEEATSLKIENETLRNQLKELRKEYESLKMQTDIEKQMAEIQKQAEIAKAVADENAKGLERLSLLQRMLCSKKGSD